MSQSPASPLPLLLLSSEDVLLPLPLPLLSSVEEDDEAGVLPDEIPPAGMVDPPPPSMTL